MTRCSQWFTRGLGAMISTAVIVATSQDIVAQAQGPSPVVASAVLRREIRVGETFVGTVMPVKMATIGSAVAGRVIEVNVEEGDLVEDGAALVQLLTATISLERDAAAAELKLREKELEELQNGTRKEELEQAEAQMMAAEARLKFLQARRERATTLFRAGQAASKDELDEALALADAATQSLRESRAAHSLAVAGPRQEKIDQAIARVAMQQAVVDKLEDQIAKHTIRARFRGYVSNKRTEVGGWLQAGEAAIELVALDIVEIEAFVPEKDIPYVTHGAQVAVQIPALGDRLFDGTVAAIVPQADTRARTFPVKIRVVNTIGDDGPLIKSGMLARVNLATGDVQQALLVPKDSLVLGGQQPMVFTVVPSTEPKGSQQAMPVPVRLGAAWGSFMQVFGTLQPGQLVVVEGNERLRPSQPVNVLKVTEPELPESTTQAGS